MIKKVYLVGAGPGDPDLITLKGRKCIKEADVLVYDRLVSQALLEERKPGCKLIYVGKENRNHVKPQDEINEILYQEAKAGKCVVRSVMTMFLVGGEEGEYLTKGIYPLK